MLGKAVPADGDQASLLVQLQHLADESGVSFQSIDLSDVDELRHLEHAAADLVRVGWIVHSRVLNDLLHVAVPLHFGQLGEHHELDHADRGGHARGDRGVGGGTADRRVDRPGRPAA